ncbi:MAG: electron transfer flavoprotein subunit alpha/FixB family protein [Anaerolineae bacterium]|nr:electron transfer flavoprotein subunit alpha/FixB family protein [Anaerolineae bacterium]
MTSKTMLVFCEKLPLMAELLGKARQQADILGWSVAALLPASMTANPGEMGADVVYGCDVDLRNPDAIVNAITAAVKQAEAQVILLGATNLGLEVSPRVAERIGCAYSPWTADFEIDTSSLALTAHCMLYAGMGVATYQFKPGPVILTAAQGVFGAVSLPGKTASDLKLDLPAVTSAVEVLDYKVKQASAVRLEDARMVVDVGQGFKTHEDLKMAEDLAGLLNGQLACSRPIASDRDWFPEWLGLSGLKIKPELCLVAGVSGAIQHIIGIRDSRVITTVNNDENAAIFAQADYGVVADLYEFLPALIERIKARGIRLA